MSLPLAANPPPARFHAATLNVFNPTPAADVAAVMAEQIATRDVRLWFLQEAGGADIDQAIRGLGLETWAFRQWRLAWDPALWAAVALWPEQMSPTAYFAKGSRKPTFSYAACGVLVDALGRSLLAGSYHTPAHVQVPQPPGRRVDVLVETMQHAGEMAAAAVTDDVMFAGDDNVDERRSFRARWLPYSQRRTGLRQHQAPGATHAGGRRIDDFRVKAGGPLRVGPGWVFSGPGDHEGHGRRFTWPTKGGSRGTG